MVTVENLISRGILKENSENANIDSIRRMLKQFAVATGMSIDVNSFFQSLKNVNNIPDLAKIEGVTEPLFKRLNGSKAIISHVGRDNVRIYSKINIKLPYKYKPSEPDYGYESVVKSQTGNVFKYVIPKQCVFRQNLCALAISKGIKPKKYNFLVRLLCVDGDYIYLHLINYSKRAEYSKKIVAIHESLALGQKRMGEIVQFFIDNDIVLGMGFIDEEEGEPFYKYNKLSVESEREDELQAVAWL
jgi:hypothetical protein